METSLSLGLTPARHDDKKILLMPSEIEDMRNNVVTKVYDFKAMDTQQRADLLDGRLRGIWCQFAGVCNEKVDSTHIADFEQAMRGVGGHGDDMRCDHVVVIFCRKFVLGFAMVAEETVEYDAITRKYLRSKPKYRHLLNTNKTLKIKLLCAREGSGVGRQLVRVCENIAMYHGCASLCLDAVPTAYGFYKSVGFFPFRNAGEACSFDGYDADATRFERAIRSITIAMRGSVEKSKNANKSTLTRAYNTYMRYCTREQEVALSGILASRHVTLDQVRKWCTDKTKLNAQLQEVIFKVFTYSSANNHLQFTDTIPMTTCLLPKVDDYFMYAKTSG